MLRKSANFVAELVAGNLIITTLLTALCALLGLVSSGGFGYLALVGLVLGAAVVYALVCANADWKVGSFYCVAFAALSVAYYKLGVHTNLHAGRAWIFLSGAAFLAAPAWIAFRFDEEKSDDRPAYAAAALTLLIVLAPLIWGTGTLELVIVLIWLAFASSWEQTQVSASYGRPLTLTTFAWGLLPLLAVLATYEVIGNKWAAAFVPLVLYFIANDRVDGQLNPQVAGRGVLA